MRATAFEFVYSTNKEVTKDIRPEHLFILTKSKTDNKMRVWLFDPYSNTEPILALTTSTVVSVEQRGNIRTINTHNSTYVFRAVQNVEVA